MTHIVVATDLSERSDRALYRAFRLAGELGASCTVISVVDDHLPREVSGQIVEAARKQIQLSVDTHASTATEVVVVEGDPPAAILGACLDRDADLLVVGMHRRREFMDAIRETTMERIVTLARQPVLLVKNPADAPYGQVLVPVSFSRECARAVSAARQIAPGARIHTFHALHVPFAGITGGSGSDMERAVRREAENAAAIWKEAFAVPGETPEIVTGSVTQVLAQEIGRNHPDLMAVGAHTRSGLALHVLGSFATELVRHPPCDLLVARS